jgi:hypothetical protein
MHWLFWQMSPAAQALPQAPQFCASLVRSTHAPEQFVWPLEH